MKKQAFAMPRDMRPDRSKATAVTKTPTTRAVVAKVQRVTAAKNGGRQAPWVNNLQSVADKRTGTQPTVRRELPTTQRQAVADSGQAAKDNTANQRNPNHEQYYKSRGLPGRPTDWDKTQPGKAATH